MSGGYFHSKCSEGRNSGSPLSGGMLVLWLLRDGVSAGRCHNPSPPSYEPGTLGGKIEFIPYSLGGLPHPNPSPRGEGLKELIIKLLLPFALGRRGWGMRQG